MGRYCLLLPKLNGAQMLFLNERLEGRGFTSRLGSRLRCRAGDVSLTVDPAGLAWSSGDLLDAIAPLLPEILAHPKEARAENPYVAAKKTKTGTELQFFTRVESLRSWTDLRRTGRSGLTPDESCIIKQLLGDAGGEVECVSDYPTERSSPFQVGRAQYFKARLPTREFVSNLRSISTGDPQGVDAEPGDGRRRADDQREEEGETRSSRARGRNTYLLRGSVLHVAADPAGLGEVSSADLGEWCYLEFPSKNL